MVCVPDPIHTAQCHWLQHGVCTRPNTHSSVPLAAAWCVYQTQYTQLSATGCSVCTRPNTHSSVPLAAAWCVYQTQYTQLSATGCSMVCVPDPIHTAQCHWLQHGVCTRPNTHSSVPLAAAWCVYQTQYTQLSATGCSMVCVPDPIHTAQCHWLQCAYQTQYTQLSATGCSMVCVPDPIHTAQCHWLQHGVCTRPNTHSSVPLAAAWCVYQTQYTQLSATGCSMVCVPDPIHTAQCHWLQHGVCTRPNTHSSVPLAAAWCVYQTQYTQLSATGCSMVCVPDPIHTAQCHWLQHGVCTRPNTHSSVPLAAAWCVYQTQYTQLSATGCSMVCVPDPIHTAQCHWLQHGVCTRPNTHSSVPLAAAVYQTQYTQLSATGCSMVCVPDPIHTAQCHWLQHGVCTRPNTHSSVPLAAAWCVYQTQYTQLSATGCSMCVCTRPNTHSSVPLAAAWCVYQTQYTQLSATGCSMVCVPDPIHTAQCHWLQHGVCTRPNTHSSVPLAAAWCVYQTQYTQLSATGCSMVCVPDPIHTAQCHWLQHGVCTYSTGVLWILMSILVLYTGI